MPSADPPTSPSSLPSSSLPQVNKPFSISLLSKSKPSTILAKPALINAKKRPHSSLAEDSDSDNDNRNHGPQLVSSFDHSAGGAIGLNGPEKQKAPLVIYGQKNRDWREESRQKRGKNLLPAEVQAARHGKVSEGKDVVNGAPQTYGLSFVKKTDGDGDISMEGAETGVGATLVTAQSERKVLTADEEALEALMGEGKRKSDLVLPALNGNQEDGEAFTGRFLGVGISEDDAFRADIASRPDMASLDDYAAVPVEEFGAALLRGMGWKEGDVVGKRKDQVSKARIVERRPALLGIGAKEVPGGVGDELGAWGKAAKGKRKVDKTYNPVLLKNARTGEMLTEEELKAKKEDQKREEEDWRARRDRNLAVDEGKKSERRRKEDYKSREESRNTSSIRERSRSPARNSSRHSSSRRDRSRSSDRRRSRRREHDDSDDYHRRDNDRRRRVGDDTRDESRSSKGRDRDGDRDRDRDKGGHTHDNAYSRDDDSRSSRSRHDDREKAADHNDTRSRRREEVY
ncbi:hypothetical protein MMC24_000943 [Lignoscripta atroalba]|nr:hypothetical protein [Lignoscripta atroalba]